MLKILPCFFVVFLCFGSTSISAEEISKTTQVSVELQGSALGLFNLQEEGGDPAFTDADLGFGITPSVDFFVAESFYLGGELMCSWAKSRLGERHRLFLNPQVRARFSLSPWSTMEALKIDVLAAIGLSYWPEDDAEDALSPALTEQRLGWSARGSVGVSYLIWEGFQLISSLGYGASSTHLDGLTATVDGMVVGVGGRWLF